MDNSKYQFTEKRPTRTNIYMLIHITVNHKKKGLLHAMATLAIRIAYDQCIQKETTYLGQSCRITDTRSKISIKLLEKHKKQRKSNGQNYRHK